MVRSYLITGASGYLGGSLLDYVAKHRQQLPANAKLYVLVRTQEQTQAVEEAYEGAKSLSFDAYDAAAVEAAIVGHGISVVIWLVDAFQAKAQLGFIDALAKVRAQTGEDVHFVHTSGAKTVSDMAGGPVSQSLADNDARFYDLHKAQKPNIAFIQQGITTNIAVVDAAEAKGVCSYVVFPCIVYGEGTGFGKKISIQTVEIVKAAKGTRRMYQLDDENAIWPVCHVSDTSSFYFRLLKAFLREDEPNPDHGKNGFYLVSSGSVAWKDIYGAMGRSLARRGVIDVAALTPADAAAKEEMAAALGCPVELVRLKMGGLCMIVSEHGKKLGWTPTYPPSHILETADDEVSIILDSMEKK